MTPSSTLTLLAVLGAFPIGLFGFSTNPVQELARYVFYNRLRRRFQQLLLSEGVVSRRGWVRAFERWQFNSKLNTSTSLLFDPLLPSLTSDGITAFESVHLIQDLMNMDNMTLPIAQRISQQITRDSTSGIKQIIDANRFHIPTEVSAPDDIDLDALPEQSIQGSGIAVDRRRYTVDFRLNSVDKERFVFRLNHEYYTHLQTLWRKSSAARRTSFFDDVFCLLVRYEALEGFGWQAGVSRGVLDCLRKHFAVDLECFSSPLNCYLPKYCSVFPDTDAMFGSLGNFFDYYPSQGSFECNPPFVAELMILMLRHIEHLIEHATGPISFLVIVPAWEADLHYVAFKNCAHQRGLLRVNAADHCYCEGAAYNRKDVFRPAPFDTALFCIQNEEGASCWPFTAVAEREIRMAFANDQPSEKWKTRTDYMGLYVPKSRRSGNENT